MKRSSLTPMWRITFGLILVLAIFSDEATAGQRFQIELYGGLSYLNPKDLNMLSEAEERYNDFYVIQRQLYKQGYFVNDFPRITTVLPAGIRLKYRISPALSLSVSAEGFSRSEDLSIEGTFTYVQPAWFDNQTKAYDPFSLELSGYAVMGGIHYQIPFGGDKSELEIGASAGWGKATFEFCSSWSNTVHFWAENYWEFQSVDGGSLRGDGTGQGLLANAHLRMNQTLGRWFGFFAEVTGTYWRMDSISGDGNETRLGIPGESSWSGEWGIKREELNLYSQSATVFVPTNYWEGWTASQWDRKFVLDLSRVQMVFGMFVRF